MQEKHPSTRAIRQQMPSTEYREHSTPLFLTSSFTFPSAEAMADTFAGRGEGIIYSRYNNPNVDELIAKACSLEGTEAGFATASGMSAVFASLAALVEQGDHIVATRAVFGSTHQILSQILPKWGVTYTYVEPDQPETWADAVTDRTRVFVTETPSNPGLQLVDLEQAGTFCRKHGITFIVDNCFATPYLQRPADYGADLITHSATKWMDGQGRVLGGLLLGRAEIMEKVIFFCRHTGPAMSPFNAWVISKSLETLAIRMDAHCRSAMTMAEWLVDQPGVESVHYPFLASHPQHDLARKQMRAGGGIVTFELKGGAAAASRLLNQAQLCTRSSNLGDTRTILTHPATTTHSKLSPEERAAVGITDGLVRMSVGLEAVADIQADLQDGLQ
ncbi:O-succinylhomoserine sulfhydrylase [Neolewinella xylanilytica]|uniref:O-succinylhomoserine sulfhydrylase n=1 Tax=Neolewinella xylanilytica TaxID=1514080 RepID=A0A2S6IBT0_9BACT|nr:aminotransferase class I/II-fold pyridoxal phosphate-dependent enzyme [Neolewinella xylanilytica]PPK88926.1 O-succinylhomoserine sulfhydrylase [Neolewinella xylanilytica]